MLSEVLGVQPKVYRAYQKEMCYITLPTKEAEDSVRQRIEQGLSSLRLTQSPTRNEDGHEVEGKRWECLLMKYDDHLHGRREAYRAKMMLHGRW